ncbi:MAG: 50S ribosomal protein L9 [Candidatus Colwellbacteria bacterium]|nr:50S ribosomal protein L9 [Candidatus Colwellbacteria bacterium]
MKVILLQDIKGVGKIYEVKNVSDGYARNFLFPRKLARIANDAAMNDLKSQKENWEKENASLRGKFTEIQDKLAKEPILFNLKTAGDDKVFGSVTKKEIETRLMKTSGKLELLKVNLERPLKTLGIHEVEIDLGRGVEGKIKIKLEKE